MPHGALDVRYPTNPKILAAMARYPAAVSIHALSIAYSADHLTDGLVPQSFPGLYLHSADLRSKVVSTLLELGLWEQADDGGYLVHHFLEHGNRSREQVEEDRREAREKKRRQRDQKKENSSPRPPPVSPRDTPGTRGRGRAERPPTSEFRSSQLDARAPESDMLGAVVEILEKAAPRLSFNTQDVAEVLERWRGHDLVKAARLAVVWGLDPEWRESDGAITFGHALRQLQKESARSPAAGGAAVTPETPGQEYERKMLAKARRQAEALGPVDEDAFGELLSVEFPS